MMLDELGFVGEIVQLPGGDWPLVQDTLAASAVPDISIISVIDATILPLLIFVPFQEMCRLELPPDR